MAYETVEQAQARILELEEENTQLKADKQTLSDDNEKAKKENEELRTLNQKYFNKLVMQEEDNGKPKKKENGDEGSKVKSVAEFAMGLKI